MAGNVHLFSALFATPAQAAGRREAAARHPRGGQPARRGNPPRGVDMEGIITGMQVSEDGKTVTLTVALGSGRPSQSGKTTLLAAGAQAKGYINGIGPITAQVTVHTPRQK